MRRCCEHPLAHSRCAATEQQDLQSRREGDEPVFDLGILEDLAVSAGDVVLLQDDLPETFQAPQVISAEVQPAGLVVAGDADPSSAVETRLGGDIEGVGRHRDPF